MQKRIYFTIIILLLSVYQSFGIERGNASWYGGKFQGRLTANGERFDTNMLTAAHKTLPFNTIVEVKNLTNNKIVHVRINDRGPFVEGRIIDLSRAAASKLEMVGTGVAPVEIRVIDSTSELEGLDYHNDETGLMQHKWIIQIASFSNRENADKVIQKLKNNNFTPLMEFTSSGFIRILLRDITNDEIEPTKEKLEGLGFPEVLLRKSSINSE